MRIGRMMHKTVTGFGSGHRGFLLLLHVMRGHQDTPMGISSFASKWAAKQGGTMTCFHSCFRNVTTFASLNAKAGRRILRTEMPCRVFVYITHILAVLVAPTAGGLPGRERACGNAAARACNARLKTLVRGKRLELSRLAALEPKSSASTNSAIPAHFSTSEAARIIHAPLRVPGGSGWSDAQAVLRP